MDPMPAGEKDVTYRFSSKSGFSPLDIVQRYIGLFRFTDRGTRNAKDIIKRVNAARSDSEKRFIERDFRK